VAATVHLGTQQLEVAHVLVIDVDGYLRFPVKEQQAAFRWLQNFIHKTREFNEAHARNQVLSMKCGEGIALAFFGDPGVPLRCAMEIGRGCPTEKLQLRMGLHSGLVYRARSIDLNRGAISEGIKVAQSVMDCGDGGHILVSSLIADLLRQMGNWNDCLHDLGEVEIKSGTRLHILNFWNEEIGNPQAPKKLASLVPRHPQAAGVTSMLGQTVSHYRILRELGAGGMGVVYEAEDIRLGRHVAVKVLPEKFSGSVAAIERFRREACTASSLNHPNICTVHDVGEHQGQHFIVMELLEGQNLRQVISSGLLLLERIVELGIQIAAGLGAAHAQRIVHRDIKPANLFVVSGERLKILDFGLAKLTGRERNLASQSDSSLHDEPTQQNITRSEEFVGTVSYMSPEQARGEPLDHRTDLFSFGVVLYEMATGVLPFCGDTSAVVFDSILNRPPIPPLRVNPRVSPELERIITRALEKRRDLRYQSAADLGAELSSLALRGGKVIELVPRAEVKTPSLQAVLLYKRNAQPDEQIMRALEQNLASQGHQVFVDRHLAVGVEWAREIESKIASADAVIPLLSAASIQSEMLAYEIQLAHSFAERQGGKPRILPVRLRFHADLPDSLHSVLDGIHYASWEDVADTERMVADLSRALAAPPAAFRRTPSLEPVGGALSIDSKFYIVRPTDREFLAAVARNDSVILVKGARQMGKTSLTARGLQQARTAGARVVLTDFQKLNAAHLQSAESLFLCLAGAIADQLDLDVVPEQSWNARRGPSMNFERFFRREILGKTQDRIVWGMDEVDRLFACSFGSEVFGLFRSWHNERSLDPSGPWQRLSLAIAYASEAHLFITDVNQSPFNVGTRLVLTDFTREQVRELNCRYAEPLRTESELDSFFALLGGQPFLTQRGLHQIVEQGLSFSQFAAGAARDEGPYGDHLRRIFVSLNQDATLCEAVRDVLSGRPSSSSDSFYRLRSSGVVAGDSACDMRLRCQLYEQYLSRYLN